MEKCRLEVSRAQEKLGKLRGILEVTRNANLLWCATWP